MSNETSLVEEFKIINDEVLGLIRKLEMSQSLLEDWIEFASKTTSEYKFLSKSLVESTRSFLTLSNEVPIHQKLEQTNE